MSHALELELHDMVSNSYVSKSYFSKKASIWEDKSGQRKNRFSKKKKDCKIEVDIFCACLMIEPRFPMLYVLVLFLVLSE